MRFTLITVLLLLSFTGTSQRDNAMFWNAYSYYNPALTAAKYKHNGYFDYRNIATDLYDMYGTYNVKIEKIKSGLGLSFDKVAEATHSYSNVFLNAAYYVPMKEQTSNFSFGINAGVLTSKFKDIVDSMGQALDIPDKSYFTADIGISYQTEKMLFGLSARHLTAPEHGSDSSEAYFSLDRTFDLQFEYKFNIGENFHLMTRTIGSYNYARDLLTLMMNAQLQFKEKYMAGVGYNIDRGFSFQLNWDIKKMIRTGYSIELLQDAAGAIIPTHEAILGILLRGKKK